MLLTSAGLAGIATTFCIVMSLPCKQLLSLRKLMIAGRWPEGKRRSGRNNKAYTMAIMNPAMKQALATSRTKPEPKAFPPQRAQSTQRKSGFPSVISVPSVVNQSLVINCRLTGALAGTGLAILFRRAARLTGRANIHLRRGDHGPVHGTVRAQGHRIKRG